MYVQGRKLNTKRMNLDTFAGESYPGTISSYQLPCWMRECLPTFVYCTKGGDRIQDKCGRDDERRRCDFFLSDVCGEHRKRELER